MKRLAQMSLAGICMIVAGMLPAVADSVVVNNSSFENGPGSNYVLVGGGSSGITGWTTTQNGVEWFNPNYSYGWGNAKDGVYVVDLAPSTYTGGGIEQSLTTVPGQWYKLQFFGSTLQAAGRDGTGQVEVWIDGVNQKTFDLSNDTATVDWQPLAVIFQAANPSTTVEFQNNQDANDHFAMIDAVSVQTALPPDLTVSITATPDVPAPGQTVTLEATVTNIGEEPTATAFDVDLYKNHDSTPPVNNETGDWTCNVTTSLAAGETATCSHNFSYPATGTYIAWAQVDTKNSVDTESDETNNTADVGVAVRLPDLRVTSLSVPATDVPVGDPVDIVATVTNVGAADALNFGIDLYEDSPGAPAGPGDVTCPVGVLHSGDSVNCPATVTNYAAGTHNVWAWADRTNTVYESNDGNNLSGPAEVNVVNTYNLTLTPDGTGTGTLSGGGTYNAGDTAYVTASASTGSVFTGWSGANGAECATGQVVMNAGKSCTATFTLVPPVDLVVSSITATPSIPAPGQQVTLKATVTNTGSVPAGAFVVDLYKNHDSTPPIVGEMGDVAPCAIGGLAAGASTTCMRTVTYAATGTYVAWAQVDTQDDVLETNETNNTGSVGVAVRLPDLRVSNLTVPTSTVTVGEAVPITATITNVGAADALNFTTDLYKNGSSAPGPSLVGDFVCPAVSVLHSGDSTTCSTTVSYAGTGTHNVWARVDRTDAVQENNEGNNVAGPASVTVALPDLYISSLNVYPSYTRVKLPTTIVAVVRNTLAYDITTPFTVDLYKHSGTAPSAATAGTITCMVPGLAAGDAYTCQGDVIYYSTGYRKVWARVDRANAIPESNEGNNLKGPVKVRIR